MRAGFVCLTLALSALPVLAGERAKNPAEAVVFIRLIGSVHAQIEELGQTRTVDRDRLELGTGSGFLVSSDGYVVTNHHVVEPNDIVISEALRKATITLKPTRIEVCLSREMVEARGAPTQCLDASIVASDAAVDVAVLSVGGSNLPYVAMGDSDVVTSGQSTQALGYPFGRLLLLEDNTAKQPQTVPELSTIAGTISAIRSSSDAERRLLQIDGNLNPGASGGPLVDKEGFVVGVIRARLTEAPTIGFAIPINQAKAFFESHGLDHLMPARSLRLGAMSNLDAKGLALRLPDGFGDSSPLRQHVEAAAGIGDLALRVDRILSPLSLKQIEQQLVGTQSFERLSQTSSTDSRMFSRASAVSALIGQETAIAIDAGTESRMLYAIVDLGREKLVARFVGSAEQVAFNESVLRASLVSLDGRRLIAGGDASPPTNWSIAMATDGQRLVPFPAGWVLEPSAPTSCRGLAAFDTQGAAALPQDFTLVLRVGVWNASTAGPDQAAAACSSRRGSLGSSSYVLRADWMGVSYTIEGVFVRVGTQRMLQMEVLSTDAKASFAHALFAEWVKHSNP
ncbi:MAG TPA: trypsin-like peptidase domain-containing protein [Vicinamibacterales bacterium]